MPLSSRQCLRCLSVLTLARILRWAAEAEKKHLVADHPFCYPQFLGSLGHDMTTLMEGLDYFLFFNAFDLVLQGMHGLAHGNAKTVPAHNQLIIKEMGG